MYVLSVRQPWAWCLFHGKNVENRTWPLPEHIQGLLVAIHASSYKRWSWAELTNDKWKTMPAEANLLELPHGAIIGIGRFTGCLTKETVGLWKDKGLYGFVWEPDKEFPKPIPCKGKLGFFIQTANLIGPW